jgi:hypothetical protein
VQGVGPKCMSVILDPAKYCGYSCQPQGRMGHDCDAPHSSLLPIIIDRYVCFSANTRLSAPKQKNVTTNNLGLAVSNAALCNNNVTKRHPRKSQYGCPKSPFKVLRSSLSKIATCKRTKGLTEGRSKPYSRPYMVSRLLYLKQTGMVYSSWNPVHESTIKSVIYSLVDNDPRLQDELAVNPFMQLRDVQSLSLSPTAVNRWQTRLKGYIAAFTEDAISPVTHLESGWLLAAFVDSPVAGDTVSQGTQPSPISDLDNRSTFQRSHQRPLLSKTTFYAALEHLGMFTPFTATCFLLHKGHLCLPLPSTGTATLHLSSGNSPDSIDASMLSDTLLHPPTLTYSPSGISTIEIVATAIRTGASFAMSSGSTLGPQSATGAPLFGLVISPAASCTLS